MRSGTGGIPRTPVSSSDGTTDGDGVSPEPNNNGSSDDNTTNLPTDSDNTTTTDTSTNDSATSSSSTTSDNGTSDGTDGATSGETSSGTGEDGSSTTSDNTTTSGSDGAEASDGADGGTTTGGTGDDGIMVGDGGASDRIEGGFDSGEMDGDVSCGEETATETETQISDELPITAIIESIAPIYSTPGTRVYFRGDFSDEGPIIAWQWRSDINGTLSTNQNFSTTHLKTGNHTIYFKVKNYDLEWSAEVTRNIIVNYNPTADAGEPYFGWKNKSITFDASHSTDIDGHIISYRWDFGDGTTSTDMVTTHRYTSVGIFTVKLKVIDDLGGYSIMTTTATIVGNQPTAHAGGPYFGTVNEPVVFNGSASNDTDGTITKYTWFFGDGISGIGKTVTHTFTKNNTYIVTLKVTDNDGDTNTDVTFAVITKPSEAPSKPELNITNSPNGNDTLRYTVVSTDPNNDMIRYVFYWGDNTKTISPFFPSGTIVTISHTWLFPGTYSIQVYAENKHNIKSETTELSVHIAKTTAMDILDDDSTQQKNHISNIKTGSFLGSGIVLDSGQLSAVITGITIALTIVISILFFLRRKEYF